MRTIEMSASAMMDGAFVGFGAGTTNLLSREMSSSRIIRQYFWHTKYHRVKFAIVFGVCGQSRRLDKLASGIPNAIAAAFLNNVVKSASGRKPNVSIHGSGSQDSRRGQS